MRILFVEDEVKISDAVAYMMRQQHMDVDVAGDGDEGLYLAEKGIYDVIILDVMLPGKTGLEILRSLRQKGDITPVLLLTALDSVQDRVQGLDYGADDYLGKPFAMPELLARVRALSRRLQSAYMLDTLKIGNVELLVDRLQMKVNEEEIKLSFKETQVMEMFMRNPGRVFHKEQILERVWGYDNDVVENNVEIYIHYLRKKLGNTSTVRIQTVRGVGYSLEATEIAK